MSRPLNLAGRCLHQMWFNAFPCEFYSWGPAPLLPHHCVVPSLASLCSDGPALIPPAQPQSSLRAGTFKTLHLVLTVLRIDPESTTGLNQSAWPGPCPLRGSLQLLCCGSPSLGAVAQAPLLGMLCLDPCSPTRLPIPV